MLDIIARLLLSAGILVGTTYLPTLSHAVSPQAVEAGLPEGASRPCSAPAKPGAPAGPRAVACIG